MTQDGGPRSTVNVPNSSNVADDDDVFIGDKVPINNRCNNRVQLDIDVDASDRQITLDKSSAPDSNDSGANSPDLTKVPNQQPSPNQSQLLLNQLQNSKPPKKVDKYYRRQTDLLESFKNDNEVIQQFQQSRLRQQSQTEPTTSSLATDNLLEISTVIPDDEPLTPTLFERQTSMRSTTPTHVSVVPNASSKSNVSSGGTAIIGRGSRAANRFAIITLIVNISLLVAKTYAAYMSGSLSIISSLVDSAVDITSGLVIWLTARAIKKRDPYLYPRGRTRLEPLALIIVSVIMGVASVQLIVQSAESMIRNTIDPHIDSATVAIMIATVVVKLILVIVCQRYKKDASISVLAQDHRNDCISNMVALLCAVAATQLWIYLDPIGAILVSIYIAVTWFSTGKEHIVMLSGRTAEPEFINRIIKDEHKVV